MKKLIFALLMVVPCAAWADSYTYAGETSINVAVSAGDLIVVCESHAAKESSPAIEDEDANTYTMCGSTFSTTFDNGMSMFYAIAGETNAELTITKTQGNMSNQSISVHVYAAASVGTPTLNASLSNGEATSPGTNHTSSTLSVSSAAIVVAFWANHSYLGDSTASGDWTKRTDSTSGHFTFNKTVEGSGNVTSTWTCSRSDQKYGYIVAAFNTGEGGSTPPAAYPQILIFQ